MSMTIATPSTAGAVGMSRSGLYRAARAGRLERIARGVYIPSDAPASDWDLVEAATRRSDATICLVSALAHHDLTDTIPDRLDVAIPRGAPSGHRRGDRLAPVRSIHFRRRTRNALRWRHRYGNRTLQS